MVLGVCMLLSVSVFAQNPAADANEKETPQNAELLSIAGKLVKYGHQTKTALPLIQALQIYKNLNVIDATDIPEKTTENSGATSGSQTKTDVVSFDEDKILEAAIQYANGNKNLLALIADTKQVTRGASGGPKRHSDCVNAHATDQYNITFRGGQNAIVIVSGDGDTDLDLFVYDENGNLIDSDTDGTDDCICTFTPRWTGKFKIKIRNHGSVYNCYTLATN